MKKLTRLISAILTIAIFLQSTALADSVPVIVKKITGNTSTEIYKGSVYDFPEFPIPWEKGKHEHMVLFDWYNNNQYYIISEDNQNEISTFKVSNINATRNTNNNLFYIDENTDILNNSIQNSISLSNDDLETNLIEISGVPTAEESFETIPEVKNTSSADNITLFDANTDTITATSFNTQIIPDIVNGINEPKFSSKEKMSEEISSYSGELTMRYNDISLPGRNGLDLNIGRIYQTAQANLGRLKYMLAPINGHIIPTVIWDTSNYYLDRYNLGAGWAFAFPSVEVITEYEYDIEETTGEYIDERTELYYHTGDGSVYQVEQTFQTNSSNLKGYYKKDLTFNKNDTTYSKNNITSAYSVTFADNTKQYFAEDGRLMAICDRYGNEIVFEHEMMTTTNRVPNGTFAYDNDMWILSDEDMFEYGTTTGEYESEGIEFNGLNAGTSSMYSQPIQVEHAGEYELSLSLKSKYDDNVNVKIQEYDWNYILQNTTERTITNLPTDEWTKKTFSVAPEYLTRYIRIIIEVENGTDELYIDNVIFDTPKPIIKKITDSIGRTAEFTYSGSVYEMGTGNITIDISAPDGSTKKLEYERKVTEYVTDFVGEDSQRLYWYLNSVDVEGEVDENGYSTSKMYYTYDGGKDSTGEYIRLHSEYDSKTLTYPDSYYNKPVLSKIKYRNSTINFEYETTRKNLGEDGFYESLRVVKRYEQEAKYQNNKIVFTGEINPVTYSYSGAYNGNTYSDETGYPNYEFTDETTLNEQWKSTAIRGNLKTENVFSNNALITNKITDLSDNTEITTSYTYHTTFKNEPTETVKTVSDSDGSRVTYSKSSYNSWGGLASNSLEVTADIYNNADLLQKYTTYYEYDDTYKLLKQKKYYNNINGNEISENNVYDSMGRLTSSTDASGKTVQYTYGNSSYQGIVTKETIVDPQGLHTLIGNSREVTYQYDTVGLYPLSITENYGDNSSTTSYTYEYIFGNVLTQTNPDNGVIYNRYDGMGRIIQSEQPYTLGNGEIFKHIYLYTYRPRTIHSEYDDGVYQAEQVSKYAYYPEDQSSYICSRNWNLYDNNGNLRVTAEVDYSQTINSLHPTYFTGYYYNTQGQLIRARDFNNISTSYSYDAFDRITEITDSQNSKYIFEYDDTDLSVLYYFVNSENSQQNHMIQQYDIYGNLISRTVYPNGTNQPSISETYSYDLAGNVIRKTDPNGNITSYQYDNLNRLNKTVLPDGTVSTTNYNYFNKPVTEKVIDDDDNEVFSRISVNNEKGDTEDKFYSWNKMLRYNNSYDYSAKGNVIQSVEGDKSIVYEYDYCDNETTRTSGEYTINSRYNPYGLSISVGNSSTISGLLYNYDNRGRITSKMQSNFTNGMQMSYTNKSLVSSITSPFGTTSAYTYDSNDRLSSAQTSSGNYSYTYYDNGMIKSVTYPNGITTEYTYDNINRVKTVITKKNNTIINNLSYIHDNNGNILTETRNGKTFTYTYDNLDRLKTANYGDSNTITYEYDALNNRTKELHSTGLVKDYSYDSYNRLTEVKENNITTDTYEYNNSGAIARHNDRLFGYDAWGNLAGVAENDNIWYYGYDVNGIRSAKICGDTSTQYFTDANANVISESDTEGNQTAEMVYANQALARKVNGNWYYYLYNAHGDVIGLTDSQGNIVNSYEYDAWGNILNQTETIDNPLKYAGQYYDEELQMYYLRARYYDPSIGRFTSIDAIEGKISQPLDMNQYVYCRNNPIRYSDPTGESVWGYGLTASVAALLGYEGQVLWVTDSSGNFALMTANGIINSIGASLSGIAFSFPDMPTLYSLSGVGFSLDGTIGNGGGGILTSGNHIGYAYTYGIGAEFDSTLASDITYTYITPLNGNIYNIASWLKKVINKVLPENMKL